MNKLFILFSLNLFLYLKNLINLNLYLTTKNVFIFQYVNLSSFVVVFITKVSGFKPCQYLRFIITKFLILIESNKDVFNYFKFVLLNPL